MLGDAFAGIAAGFSQALGGPYHAARVVTVTDAVFDDGGSIVTPGDFMARDCLCQVDAVTEAMRGEEGFTDKDVRLLVISLMGGLDTDAQVIVAEGAHAGTYTIQSVGRDPFAIYRECRGRLI